MKKERRKDKDRETNRADQQGQCVFDFELFIWKVSVVCMTCLAINTNCGQSAEPGARSFSRAHTPAAVCCSFSSNNGSENE